MDASGCTHTHHTHTHMLIQYAYPAEMFGMAPGDWLCCFTSWIQLGGPGGIITTAGVCIMILDLFHFAHFFTSNPREHAQLICLIIFSLSFRPGNYGEQVGRKGIPWIPACSLSQMQAVVL
jgi:hypothetical protein